MPLFPAHSYLPSNKRLKLTLTHIGNTVQWASVYGTILCPTGDASHIFPPCFDAASPSHAYKVPYILPSSVCCKSFICRSYAKCRGDMGFFPFWLALSGSREGFTTGFVNFFQSDPAARTSFRGAQRRGISLRLRALFATLGRASYRPGGLGEERFLASLEMTAGSSDRLGRSCGAQPL